MFEWQEQYLMSEPSEQDISEILVLPQEHKIHIFKLTCNSDHFPKIFQNCSESQMKIAEHFWKISEDCWRLSRKTQRCFEKYATRVPDVVSYEFYKWCIF